MLAGTTVAEHSVSSDSAKLNVVVLGVVVSFMLRAPRGGGE
jgi:hypothetical protein